MTDGLPDLEIARFMTAYGGRTDHAVDVSELAPLLRGQRTFRAFVDTWVTVPASLARVVLRYFSTGHCTDGRDDDEFVSKANVIAVDGVVVARFHPWRDDCRRFREVNPYCARWTDGTWSSDYSRSG